MPDQVRHDEPSIFAFPSSHRNIIPRNTVARLHEKVLALCTPHHEDPAFLHKKALHFDPESPLTHCEFVVRILLLECAERPSGVSKPSTWARQSLVLGFLYAFILR
jgi:hypothetical protein